MTKVDVELAEQRQAALEKLVTHLLKVSNPLEGKEMVVSLSYDNAVNARFTHTPTAAEIDVLIGHLTLLKKSVGEDRPRRVTVEVLNEIFESAGIKPIADSE